jgi:hypothetical protein
VEAQKRLYQGIPVAQRASRRVFVPVLSPQGAPSLGMRFAGSSRFGDAETGIVQPDGGSAAT